MKFSEVFNESKINKIPDKTVIGIDIGSRQSKAVLIHKNEVYTALIPTGFYMKQTADELLQELFEQSKITLEEIEFIVGTGYGRVALDFDSTPNRMVTEISCHGLGAHYIGDNINTIIDIGGQDSKVIRISPEDGKVIEFAMNDKCAAGTGRFLEKIADVLGLDATQIGEISLQSDNPTNISSQCVVFAESEVVSGRAKGYSVSDLAAGIHFSVVKRVNTLLNRVGIVPNILFTGGVSNNSGVKKALENILGFSIAASKIDTVYAGAIGAAIYAGKYAEEKVGSGTVNQNKFELDITALQDAIQLYQEDYTNKRTGKKKNIAYLCAYTPVEILNAANVASRRLLHIGSQREIAAGEGITQSVFCDLTKSILGGFAEENPLFKSIDHVYTFYTCDCMRKSAEAIGLNYVPTTIYNLPRLRDVQYARDYFVSEVEGFKENLERLTGETIEKEDIRKSVHLYNEARALIRQISEFRKHDIPLLTSEKFQQIALGYYYLPIDTLLVHLKNIVNQLENAKPSSGEKPVRLMLSGSVIAEGDTKITKIVEEDLGARIVVEDNCSGIKPFLDNITITDNDIIEDIADGYLGKAPCARMKPIEDMIENSVKLAADYKADGIVFYFIKFCPCYSMILRSYLDRFQKMDIPVLVVSGDYTKGDEGQIKTRIEAFIEVLKERS